jgi:hypothetical protein
MRGLLGCAVHRTANGKSNKALFIIAQAHHSPKLVERIWILYESGRGCK